MEDQEQTMDAILNDREISLKLYMQYDVRGIITMNKILKSLVQPRDEIMKKEPVKYTKGINLISNIIKKKN